MANGRINVGGGSSNNVITMSIPWSEITGVTVYKPDRTTTTTNVIDVPNIGFIPKLILCKANTTYSKRIGTHTYTDTYECCGEKNDFAYDSSSYHSQSIQQIYTHTAIYNSSASDTDYTYALTEYRNIVSLTNSNEHCYIPFTMPGTSYVTPTTVDVTIYKI